MNPSADNAALLASMLKDGYKLRMRVTGSSMSPFLEPGSCVTLFREPLSEVHVGDIVYCCGADGRCRLHRLLAIKNGMLITKGDALGLPDPPFDKKEYLGKVLLIEQQTDTALVRRSMELRSAQTRNYLIAACHRFKLHLIGRFFKHVLRVA